MTYMKRQIIFSLDKSVDKGINYVFFGP